MISRRTMLVAGAAAAVPVLCSIPAFAQMDDTGGGGGGKAKGHDAHFATWMAIDGYKQIQVSKPAQEKAKDDAVKAFAKAEIEEHETLKKRLMEKGLKPIVQPGQTGGGGGSGGGTGGGGANGMGTAADILMHKNEIAVQCVESTNAEGEKKEGMMFDDFYVNQQLVAHMELKDTVTVAMKHASGDMKPILTEAMGIIETHLASLKQMKQKMMQQMKNA